MFLCNSSLLFCCLILFLFDSWIMLHTFVKKALVNVCKCIFFKDNREYRLNIRLKKCNEKSLALSVPALKSLQKSPKSSCSEILYRYVMVKRRLVRWTPSEQCTWPPSTPSPSDGGTFRRKSLNTPNDRRAEIWC